MAGARFALLTATHETGFALYQSEVNPYCMKALKWKDGKGDLVSDFVAACRKYDMQPDIYLGIRWNSFFGVHDFVVEGSGEMQKSGSNLLYFNRYQAGPEGEPLAAKFSINTLQKVYNYDPYPAALSKAETAYVIGGQAAIWTEFIPSVEHLEYMLLPLLPAIAEALWSPVKNKNYNAFVDRLNQWHFNSWQQKGIRFHPAYFKSK